MSSQREQSADMLPTRRQLRLAAAGEQGLPEAGAAAPAAPLTRRQLREQAAAATTMAAAPAPAINTEPPVAIEAPVAIAELPVVAATVTATASETGTVASTPEIVAPAPLTRAELRRAARAAEATAPAAARPAPAPALAAPGETAAMAAAPVDVPAPRIASVKRSELRQQDRAAAKPVEIAKSATSALSIKAAQTAASVKSAASGTSVASVKGAAARTAATVRTAASVKPALSVERPASAAVQGAGRASGKASRKHQWVPRLALLGTLAVATTVVPLTGAALPTEEATQTPAAFLAPTSALDVLTNAGVATADAAASLAADPLASARAAVVASRAGDERQGLACESLTYEANGLLSADVTTTPLEVVMPLAAGSYRLTSPYGLRSHPIYGSYGEHTGMDMASASGTPIHAVADGVVTYVGGGRDGRSGMLIIIKHEIDGADVYTWYVHMYPDGVYVSEGETVTAGTVIGAVGSYGNSTGPHLHLEVHLDANLTTTDPGAWLAEHNAAPLTAENLACTTG